MQFFDLNVPYVESDDSVSDKSSKKQIRLKQIVKSMEFGFSGIAYNRTIKGVMSESDRCTISPFPLSSLLNVSPSLSSAVTFHRRLLGVPETSAFRQYTRLTMSVETSAQAAALNSGNPVLKTYDLVAVRPLNQISFDIACQSSQIDLISIDFGEKLPFRLKLPMVKAAIARGVSFEIMYSSLIRDAQVRRQMISNAKFLVEWTRGKNLIVSSAAPSVLELRGPNDVANLLSLLGLSNESAKETISKNCRWLISNALRKKQFYKEAIRVELMPPRAQTDPNEPWIVDHHDWDPLSSGEGDLLLGDMAKAFAESGKVFQTAKGIDFSSNCDSVRSYGLQLKDTSFLTEGNLCTSGNFMDVISNSKDLEVLKMTPQNQPTSLCNSVLVQKADFVEGQDSQRAVLFDALIASKDLEVPQKIERPQDEPTLRSSLVDQQGDADDDSQQALLPDSPVASTNINDSRMPSALSLQCLKNFDALDTTTSTIRLTEPELLNRVIIHSNNALFSDSMKETTSEDDGLNVGCFFGSKRNVFKKPDGLDCNGAQTDNLKVASGVFSKTDAWISTKTQLCDQSDLSLSSDISLDRHLLGLKKDPMANKILSLHVEEVMDFDSIDERHCGDGSLLGDWQSLEEVDRQKEQKEDDTEIKTATKKLMIADTMMPVPPLEQEQDGNDCFVAKSMLSDHMMMASRKEIQEIGEAAQSFGEKKLGNRKVKRRDTGQVFRFPFKRFLQGQFKKKGRNFMYKKKTRCYVVYCYDLEAHGGEQNFAEPQVENPLHNSLCNKILSGVKFLLWIPLALF